MHRRLRGVLRVQAGSADVVVARRLRGGAVHGALRRAVASVADPPAAVACVDPRRVRQRERVRVPDAGAGARPRRSARKVQSSDRVPDEACNLLVGAGAAAVKFAAAAVPHLVELGVAGPTLMRAQVASPDSAVLRIRALGIRNRQGVSVHLMKIERVLLHQAHRNLRQSNEHSCGWRCLERKPHRAKNGRRVVERRLSVRELHLELVARDLCSHQERRLPLLHSRVQADLRRDQLPLEIAHGRVQADLRARDGGPARVHALDLDRRRRRRRRRPCGRKHFGASRRAPSGCAGVLRRCSAPVFYPRTEKIQQKLTRFKKILRDQILSQVRPQLRVRLAMFAGRPAGGTFPTWTSAGLFKKDTCKTDS